MNLRTALVIGATGRSRRAGFLDYQGRSDTFLNLFRRLQTERIIPCFET